MNPVNIGLLVAASFLGGCIVVHDQPRTTYVDPGPAPAGTVVVQEDEEVNYVVYRDYFGCTEDEVAYLPHYRRYYGCSDDDFYFCYFVSRRMGLSFDVCFRSYYYDCGRSCDRLVLYYRVPRQYFFVAVGPGVAYPPIYSRPYSCYHSGSYTSVSFSNQEYVALVHMKVGVEYQGHTTGAYFARVNECGGNTGRVIVKSKDNCGRGGSTVTGGTVQKPCPRPWTMPGDQKHTWEQAHKDHVTRSETSFKESHKEQVQKAPNGPKSSPGHEDHPSGRPETPPGRGPAAEKTPPPGHEDGNRGKGPGANDGGPKHSPPERGGKAPEHREDAPPPKPPPPSDSRNKEKGGNDDKGRDTQKDSPPPKPPPPPPPSDSQKNKGGNDDREKDKKKDSPPPSDSQKDKKKDAPSDRSEKNRRQGP